MIDLCAAAGLPAPDFEIRNGSFVVTLWRDWLTNEVLGALNLNERQLAAIGHLKSHGTITNSEYQVMTVSTKKTASRDLTELTGLGVTTKIGTTGRGVHYVISKKGDIKGTKGTY